MDALLKDMNSKEWEEFVNLFVDFEGDVENLCGVDSLTYQKLMKIKVLLFGSELAGY